MIRPDLVIVLLWMVFLIVWIAMGGSAKPTAEAVSRRHGLAHRLPMFFGALLIFFGHRVRPQLGLLDTRLWPATPLRDWLAIGFVFVGLLIALQARFALGTNWSGRVTIKQDHELITSGPYAWVRHPIYTGILLMIGGSALTIATPMAFVGFLVFLAGVVVKLRQEEALMMRQFPASYPDYRGSVKRLVPFVW
jgi:protein-S-isoprenylcysteine O-methyltransferase Ste14